MVEEATDYISVQAAVTREMTADRASLHVTIKGTSLFTGDAALKKAREVAQLVADLTGYGVLPEDITLAGVSADVSSGSVMKASLATYRLRVHCARLESLADIIGIVTNQKNTTLRNIEWGYPDTQALQDEWLMECITSANNHAAQIAKGLGVRLLGVHRFTERFSDSEQNAALEGLTLHDTGTPMRRRSGPMTGEDLGMEVSHRKTVEVGVGVVYRVSGFE